VFTVRELKKRRSRAPVIDSDKERIVYFARVGVVVGGSHCRANRSAPRRTFSLWPVKSIAPKSFPIRKKATDQRGYIRYTFERICSITVGRTNELASRSKANPARIAVGFFANAPLPYCIRRRLQTPRVHVTERFPFGKYLKRFFPSNRRRRRE